METLKSLTLLIVLLFGAYAQYKAQSNVQLKNEADQKRSELLAQTTPADFEFMKKAIGLSRSSTDASSTLPFGSVVVKDNTIIGEGWNKTHIVHDPSAHAEVEAIRDACKNTHSTTLEGSVLYTSAEPCPMCLSLIYLTGVEKVYYCIPGSELKNELYSRSHTEIYNALTTPQIDRPVSEIQIMQEEASALLESYRKTNNIKKVL